MGTSNQSQQSCNQCDTPVPPDAPEALCPVCLLTSALAPDPDAEPEVQGDDSARPDPMLGRTVLGNYVVEKKLGAGAMGAVYRLKHNRLPDTYAALKVMTGEDSAQAQARFQQEAMVAAAIGSHRVAKPIDLGCFDDGTPYIVMEYVDGKSLGQELNDLGPLPVTTALKIACRVADTLAIAHEKEIVHRDIKPPNIMLVREGERDAVVKVLDFGVARASGAIKLAHTAHNVMIGTFGYMSPESATGVEVDGRADVFSLGVVLFEMLTGDVPYGGSTLEQRLASVLSDPVPSVGARRPSFLEPVPPNVEHVVTRAIAKKASERFTMLEFYRELAALLVDPSREVPSIVRPSKPRPVAPQSPAVGELESMIDRLNSPRPLQSNPPGSAPTAATIISTAPGGTPRLTTTGNAATMQMEQGLIPGAVRSNRRQRIVAGVLVALVLACGAALLLIHSSERSVIKATPSVADLNNVPTPPKEPVTNAASPVEPMASEPGKSAIATRPHGPTKAAVPSAPLTVRTVSPTPSVRYDKHHDHDHAQTKPASTPAPQTAIPATQPLPVPPPPKENF